jgi:amino acid transporter
VAELRRVLPLRTAVTTSAGLASAAVNFFAAVEVAQYAGGRSAWLALLVAGLLITLSAANFSELSGLYPSAAAIRVWIRRGANDRLSMIGSLVYMVTVVLVVAADAFVLGHVFTAIVPGVPGLVWIAALLGLVTWANLRGVKVAGFIQDGNGLFLLGSLMVISVLGLTHVAPGHFAGVFHLGGNWLQSVALGVFIFVGFEWVTPLAEEFTDTRMIPRGMFLALGLVAVAFALFSLAQQTLLAQSQVAGSLVPQLLVGRAALGAFGFWWMVVASLTTAMTTFNGGFVAASRFIYAAARERVLPPLLARLNERFVPKYALIGLFLTSLVLAAVVYVTGRYIWLINTGAAVESFMYVMAGFLVVSLRRREPQRERPFRVPWGTVLPWLSMVIFFVLGLGSLTASSDIPGPVPWSLVFLLVLTLASIVYVYKVVPRLKEAPRVPAAPPRQFEAP